MIWLTVIKNGWTWAVVSFVGLLVVASLHDKAKLEWELERQQHKLAVAEAQADALVKERALIEGHQRALEELINDNRKTDVEQARLLAGIDNGIVRLRGRFQCQTPVPSTPGTPSNSDGASGGGLLNSDAEFLVRLAGDADRRVNQLTACQNIIKEYNEQLRTRQE